MNLQHIEQRREAGWLQSVLVDQDTAKVEVARVWVLLIQFDNLQHSPYISKRQRPRTKSPGQLIQL